MLSYTGVTTF